MYLKQIQQQHITDVCWVSFVVLCCLFAKLELRLLNTREPPSPSSSFDLWPTDPTAGDADLWPAARDLRPGDPNAGDGDLTQLSRGWLVLPTGLLCSSALGGRLLCLFLSFLAEAGVRGVNCLGTTGDGVELPDAPAAANTPEAHINDGPTQLYTGNLHAVDRISGQGS